MTDSGNQLRGVVHGQSIELTAGTGLPDGQEVRVYVYPVGSPQEESARDAILRTAGAWNDDIEGLNAYLEWSRRQRHLDERREIEH